MHRSPVISALCVALVVRLATGGPLFYERPQILNKVEFSDLDVDGDRIDPLIDVSEEEQQFRNITVSNLTDTVGDAAGGDRVGSTTTTGQQTPAPENDQTTIKELGATDKVDVNTERAPVTSTSALMPKEDTTTADSSVTSDAEPTLHGHSTVKPAVTVDVTVVESSAETLSTEVFLETTLTTESKYRSSSTSIEAIDTSTASLLEEVENSTNPLTEEPTHPTTTVPELAPPARTEINEVEFSSEVTLVTVQPATFELTTAPSEVEIVESSEISASNTAGGVYTSTIPTVTTTVTDATSAEALETFATDSPLVDGTEIITTSSSSEVTLGSSKTTENTIISTSAENSSESDTTSIEATETTITSSTTDATHSVKLPEESSVGSTASEAIDNTESTDITITKLAIPEGSANSENSLEQSLTASTSRDVTYGDKASDETTEIITTTATIAVGTNAVITTETSQDIFTPEEVSDDDDRSTVEPDANSTRTPDTVSVAYTTSLVDTEEISTSISATEESPEAEKTLEKLSTVSTPAGGATIEFATASFTTEHEASSSQTPETSSINSTVRYTSDYTTHLVEATENTSTTSAIDSGKIEENTITVSTTEDAVDGDSTFAETTTIATTASAAEQETSSLQASENSSTASTSEEASESDAKTDKPSENSTATITTASEDVTSPAQTVETLSSTTAEDENDGVSKTDETTETTATISAADDPKNASDESTKLAETTTDIITTAVVTKHDESSTEPLNEQSSVTSTSGDTSGTHNFSAEATDSSAATVTTDATTQSSEMAEDVLTTTTTTAEDSNESETKLAGRTEIASTTFISDPTTSPVNTLEMFATTSTIEGTSDSAKESAETTETKTTNGFSESTSEGNAGTSLHSEHITSTVESTTIVDGEPITSSVISTITASETDPVESTMSANTDEKTIVTEQLEDGNSDQAWTTANGVSPETTRGFPDLNRSFLGLTTPEVITSEDHATDETTTPTQVLEVDFGSSPASGAQSTHETSSFLPPTVESVNSKGSVEVVGFGGSTNLRGISVPETESETTTSPYEQESDVTETTSISNTDVGNEISNVTRGDSEELLTTGGSENLNYFTATTASAKTTASVPKDISVNELEENLADTSLKLTTVNPSDGTSAESTVGQQSEEVTTEETSPHSDVESTERIDLESTNLPEAYSFTENVTDSAADRGLSSIETTVSFTHLPEIASTVAEDSTLQTAATILENVSEVSSSNPEPTVEQGSETLSTRVIEETDPTAPSVSRISSESSEEVTEILLSDTVPTLLLPASSSSVPSVEEYSAEVLKVTHTTVNHTHSPTEALSTTSNTQDVQETDSIELELAADEPTASAEASSEVVEESVTSASELTDDTPLATEVTAPMPDHTAHEAESSESDEDTASTKAPITFTILALVTTEPAAEESSTERRLTESLSPATVASVTEDSPRIDSGNDEETDQQGTMESLPEWTAAEEPFALQTEPQSTQDALTIPDLDSGSRRSMAQTSLCIALLAHVTLLSFVL
ncbi:platelet binding protein GspB-like [Anopheles nili]|uniref:platelet binding protein GspB-like n=1 Tax=Anopheles nili TaxID=185578 RepID=UPI00237AB35F|nr:platelet binding protein GspB-like [Anopheles nili]